MTLPLQRQVFLNGEGDAWFERNFQDSPAQISHWSEHDPLLKLLLNLPLPKGPEVSVLEVGCGQGLRLACLNQIMGWSVSGLDPSQQAIKEVSSQGINGSVGTADSLPASDSSVDLLIYGFCLYLCDRDDLFEIISEANRVLKDQAWLAIIDFWTPSQQVNAYHHRPGINSYKDDLPAIFTWHPSYVVTDHCVRHHVTGSYTDDLQEMVGATILRKSICNSDVS